MKTKYALGFLFRNIAGETEVALMRKTHPDWQSGKLNGIGGHVERDEEPVETMIREFKEETGAETHNWSFFCTMIFEEAIIYCFKSMERVEVKTITDEEVIWFRANWLPDKVIPNLRWLIPMALDNEYLMLQVDMQLKRYNNSDTRVIQ